MCAMLMPAVLSGGARRAAPHASPESDSVSRAKTVVAYFSMEIGLHEQIPTYSGGLGMLAGDHLRAAADMRVAIVGVTLLYRKGHPTQQLDKHGQQTEHDTLWDPETLLERLPVEVSITLEGRTVRVGAWHYRVTGVAGHTVPVLLLDTALPENDPWDQSLTDRLYGGDDRYRLCQEAVLGLGGVAMLRALGYDDAAAYHMNEGHSALLTLALVEERARTRGHEAEVTAEDIATVRERCVFTTHTPVPAGHDKFALDLVRYVLGDQRTARLEMLRGCAFGMLNMTTLAMAGSRYTNGVSRRHMEVTGENFPDHLIAAITNGVHGGTWTSPSFARLFDRHIPDWRRDNQYLRYAGRIPLGELQAAHDEAKTALLAEVEKRTGRRLDPTALTIGFARRATSYKRADLIFTDLERLRRIGRRTGPLQIIYAGKAHPRDEGGKALIRRVFEAAAALETPVRVIYVENYDMELGRLLTAGVDLWLNTPQRPQEASGTSGMKAALNGVPSLSVLDGWWVEGHVEGVTGWSIMDGPESVFDTAAEVASLYDKLEYVIAPMFYGRPAAYAAVMQSTIALNGSVFNAERMVAQYLRHAYEVAG